MLASFPFQTFFLENKGGCSNPMTESLAHDSHLRVLSESFPMNTNMTALRCFSKIFLSLCFERK